MSRLLTLTRDTPALMQAAGGPQGEPRKLPVSRMDFPGGRWLIRELPPIAHQVPGCPGLDFRLLGSFLAQPGNASLAVSSPAAQPCLVGDLTGGGLRDVVQTPLSPHLPHIIPIHKPQGGPWIQDSSQKCPPSQPHSCLSKGDAYLVALDSQSWDEGC